MSEKPVKDYDKFMLRLPEGMRGAIAERAKKNSRSMNSEIVQILEDALASDSSADIHFSEAEVAELTGISVEAINELTNALKQSTDTINKLKATLIHSHKG